MNENQDSINELNFTRQQQHQIDIATTTIINHSSHLNLPPRDLLDGRREDFYEICVPLYKAATIGDQKAAKVILDKCMKWVWFSITESYETVLHIAVLGKSHRFVEYLMGLLRKEDLELVNRNGETALCIAAIAGNVDMAKILVTKNEGLLNISNSQGKMPLYMAALYGRRDMVKYLYHASLKMSGGFWTNENRGCVVVTCVESNLFDVALEMVTDNPQLAVNKSVLELLARKPYAFDGLKPHILKRLLYSSGYLEENHGLRLLRVILIEMMKLPKAEFDELIKGPPAQVKEGKNRKYPSGVLFLAAEMGNTAFLGEVIRQYPHLVREVSDNNQTIFHVAVSHRHEGVFKLLDDMGSIKDMIVTIEDKYGNNMLHLAGDRAMGDRPQKIPGEGLQLKLEVLWFKQVEAILPTCFREKRNHGGQTPVELFMHEHKLLFSHGDKWMKEIATQLMVVAALIATISFAAVFTFPGGYDQQSGIPIFLGNNLSRMFMIFDSLSFISSTASILVVLSILMDNYDPYDFMVELPKLMMICLVFMFISIVTIILTFLVSLFLLCQSNSYWTPIAISACVAILYSVFAISKYRHIVRFLCDYKMIQKPLF